MQITKEINRVARLLGVAKLQIRLYGTVSPEVSYEVDRLFHILTKEEQDMVNDVSPMVIEDLWENEFKTADIYCNPILN
jgi:hypothetical protein